MNPTRPPPSGDELYGILVQLPMPMRIPTAALLIALATPAVAEPAYILGVIDGDSYRANINGQVVTVRLASADAPEKGQRARCDRERALAERATARAGELLTGKTVDLRPLPGKADKYGRYLGSITVDGADLATVLIREGLAVPYSGRGARQDWCAPVNN